MKVELLPELITEILLRLPAKSLLRFRCLSNSRRDEIDSSDFVHIHLKRSIQTRCHRKLIFTNGIDYYASDFDDGLKKSIPCDPDQCNARIIGSCHGLILLLIRPDIRKPNLKLFLWNSTTQHVKKLPTFPDRSFDQLLSLGYDSVSDDYKVVRISEHLPKLRSSPRQVWVFSLKSNSWRRVQDLHLDNVSDLWRAGFANGFLYWTYFQPPWIKVGCFDLANEVFFTLPGFRSPHDGGLLDRLGGADRSVAINIVIVDEIVLMHKYYVEAQVEEFYSPVVGENSALPGGNWSKAFAFTFEAHLSNIERGYRALCTPKRPSGTTYSPLAYSKDWSCILFHKDKDLFWYNVEKKTRCGLSCFRGIPVSDSMEYYVVWESLVPLGNDAAFQV